jgi:6-phosphogluconolactonase (cycloisomerase 2 family)
MPVLRFRLATIFSLFALLLGCGGSQPQPAPPAPLVVTVAPSSSSVVLGNTQQFTAAVSGSTNTAVAWDVNGIPGGNSAVGTISASGAYTAPAVLPSPAVVVLGATSQADASKSAVTTVTIVSDVAVAISLSLPPLSGALRTGSSTTLTATISSSGKPDPAVTWTVNGVAGGNATFGAITGSNPSTYLAPGVVPVLRRVTITATSVADPSKSASISETIVGEFLYATDVTANAILGFQVNAVTGALMPVLSRPTGNFPRAMTVYGNYLYVASFNDNAVSAYSIDPFTGTLSPIGSPVATGQGPQSMVTARVLDSPYTFLYVANFQSADISGYSINFTTGELTPLANSPYTAGAEVYAIATSFDRSFLYVTDNGYGRVWGFAVDATTGDLVPVPGAWFPAGTNPHGLASYGSFLYVTEVPDNVAGHLFVYRIGADGALTPLANSPFATGPEPEAIAFGSILSQEPVRSVNDFAYLTLNGGPAVEQFAIDDSGVPTEIGTPVAAQNPWQVVVAGLRPSQFVYVTNPNLGTITAYAINPDGTLAVLPGSPVAAGTAPTGIVIAFPAPAF